MTMKVTRRSLTFADHKAAAEKRVQAAEAKLESAQAALAALIAAQREKVEQMQKELGE